MKSQLKSERFDYSSKTCKVDLLAKSGDEWDMSYDAKVFPNGPKMSAEGEGKSGVQFSEAKDGKVHVSFGDTADGKGVTVIIMK